MPGTGEIAALIQDLSSDSRPIRERAAKQIYGRGCELARAAMSAWIADSELTRYFVLGDRGLPRMTVGIAVNPDEFERVQSANGSPRLAEVPPDQDAKEFELHFEGGVSLDILTTRAPEGSGAIARYLQKQGAGIQQVEILVNDVDRATEMLRERFGLASVYPATRPGADGTRVNFFFVPVRSQKVLIEFVESLADSADAATKSDSSDRKRSSE